MNRQKLQFPAWSQSALTFVLEPWGDVFLLVDKDVLIVEWEQEGRPCQVVWHPDQIAFWAEGTLSFLAVHHYDEQGI